MTLNVALVPENGGSLTPGFAGATDRSTGTAYTITAQAAPGFVFAGWTGSRSDRAATISFTMTPGFSLQANFVPDPLLAARGNYNGLVMADTPTNESSGWIKISVTAGGEFTGKLNLAGLKCPFAGFFDSAGLAHFRDGNRPTKTLPRSSWQTPLELGLQLDVVNSSHKITGTLADSGVLFSAIMADQALFTDATSPIAPQRNVPVGMAGAYTFIFPPVVVAGIELPRGNGWGRMQVGADGSVRVAGLLADGAEVAFSTSLAQDGTLPMYVSLYHGRGAICGPVSLVSQPGSDVNGTVVWFKPAAAARTFYPSGWPDGVMLNLRGSHFVPAADGGASVLASIGLGGLTNVSFQGGNLPGDVKGSASVSFNKVILVPPAVVRGFTLAIKPGNGVFTGEFVHPVSQVPRQFRGVLLQNQGEAAGFFLDTTESGAIEVAPSGTN